MKAIKRYIKLFKERLEMGLETSDNLAEGFGELIQLIKHSRQEDERAMIKIADERIEMAREILRQDKKEMKKYPKDMDLKQEILINENIIVEHEVLKIMIKSHYGGSK